MDKVLILTLLGLFVVNQCSGQAAYQICATSRFDDYCTQLQRGNSLVNCVRVQDSVECAQRIRNKTAHIGIFSAESTLHLATIGWDNLAVVKELRHQDRTLNSNDFSSVVVVRSTHQNGFTGLQGSKYCHPGYFYDRTQKWSERFLKHFDRNVVLPNCDGPEVTAAEIETATLANFFGPSCRPGYWSMNRQEDQNLKEKYPNLCANCAHPNNCSHADLEVPVTNNYKALNCLINGGDVAYTSLEDAQRFFTSDRPDLIENYAFLCANGSVQPISTPCTWLDQPWKTIIVPSEDSVQMKTLLTGWMYEGLGTGSWQSYLRDIIGMDSYMMVDTTIQSPIDYFRPFREIPTALPLCSTTSTWCTTSYEEKDKCEVIRAGGIAAGIYPQIDCREPTTSTVACLSDISANRADFMGIDSNFGYLARKPHNLGSAMYAETEYGKYSTIVVVIKSNSTFTRFENLKNSKACFPEYAGIAAIAFVNLGRNRGFLNSDDCNYDRLLGDFFDSACLPGAQDTLHSQNNSNTDSLCALCRPSIGIPDIIIPAEAPGDVVIEGGEVQELMITRSAEVNCAADYTNRFYGNAGALQCLNEVGDVAVVELQYLREHAMNNNLNEHDFRIMCRNGSLADTTGFAVDEACALTTIVDGEVVVRRGSSKTTGIISALTSFDSVFQSDPDFKMYNIFAGKTDLLFKDSTLGLTPEGSTGGVYVSNYISLFDHLDRCIQARDSATSATISMMALMVVFIITCIQSFFN